MSKLLANRLATLGANPLVHERGELPNQLFEGPGIVVPGAVEKLSHWGFGRVFLSSAHESCPGGQGVAAISRASMDLKKASAGEM